MTHKYDIFLMVINAIFSIINGFFVAIGTSYSGVNLIAAIWCMAGFCIALSHYLNKVDPTKEGTK